MNIIIALLIFSIIIIIHELGHFLLAKKNGVGVTEFSLGMGPRLFSFTKGETRYSLKLFPIGGSCMMLGEDEESDDERAFNKKNVWARISVIFAGPLFNFLLAFILAVIIIGYAGYDPANVINVTENSAASEAGLKVGDVITKIGNKKIVVGRDVSSYQLFNEITGKPIDVTFIRDGKKQTVTLKPEGRTVYKVGFGYNGTDNEPAIITSVSKGEPFAEAGIEKNDIIIKMNDTEIKNGLELSQYMKTNPLSSEPVKVTYLHNSLERTATITPKNMGDVYDLGFASNTYATEKASFFGVIKYSAYEVKYWIDSTFKSIGMLISGKVGADELAGPVGIVDMMGNIVDSSKPAGLWIVIVNLMSFCIMLSANLGVMNLLPIPALDGGRLVFLIIEAVRGKPINREKEGMVHFIGLVALMLLMVFVFYNDISRLF